MSPIIIAPDTEPVSPLRRWPALLPEHPLSQLRSVLPEIIGRANHNEVYGVRLSLNNSDAFSTNLILQKFLRANGNDVHRAREQLERTLIWRRMYRPLERMREAHSGQHFDGLGYVAKLDNGERTDVVAFNLYGDVHDINFTFGDMDKFMRWRVGLMEKSLQLLDLNKVNVPIPDYGDGPDPYTISQVHDYVDTSTLWANSRMKRASKKTVDVFLSYYPETLSTKYIINLSSPAIWIYRLINMFTPKRTRDKFVYLRNGAKLGDYLSSYRAVLPSRFGGRFEGTMDEFASRLLLDSDSVLEERVEEAAALVDEQPLPINIPFSNPDFRSTTSPRLPSPIPGTIASPEILAGADLDAAMQSFNPPSVGDAQFRRRRSSHSISPTNTGYPRPLNEETTPASLPVLAIENNVVSDQALSVDSTSRLDANLSSEHVAGARNASTAAPSPEFLDAVPPSSPSLGLLTESRVLSNSAAASPSATGVSGTHLEANLTGGRSPGTFSTGTRSLRTHSAGMLSLRTHSAGMLSLGTHSAASRSLAASSAVTSSAVPTPAVQTPLIQLSAVSTPSSQPSAAQTSAVSTPGALNVSAPLSAVSISTASAVDIRNDLVPSPDIPSQFLPSPLIPTESLPGSVPLETSHPSQEVAQTDLEGEHAELLNATDVPTSPFMSHNMFDDFNSPALASDASPAGARSQAPAEHPAAENPTSREDAVLDSPPGGYPDSSVGSQSGSPDVPQPDALPAARTGASGEVSPKEIVSVLTKSSASESRSATAGVAPAQGDGELKDSPLEPLNPDQANQGRQTEAKSKEAVDPISASSVATTFDGMSFKDATSLMDAATTPAAAVAPDQAKAEE